MFTREHRLPDHVLRFSVQKSKTGWDVTEEIDGRTVFSFSYSDWHRVERRLRKFEAEAETLGNRAYANEPL